MSDNIRFSSEKYASIARQLDDIAAALTSAKSALSAIDLSRAEGADIPVSLPMLKLSGGNRRSAGTPAKQINVLSNVLESETDFVQSVRSAIATADSLFNDAENHILNMLAGKAVAENSSPNTELNEIRMDAVQVLLNMLNMDNENLNDLIDVDELTKIIGAGVIYNGISGNVDSYLVDPHYEIAMGIIKSLGVNVLPDKTLINAASDTINALDKTLDTVDDINTIVFDKETSEMFSKMLRSLPFSEKDIKILEKLDIKCLNDITDLGLSAELIGVAKKVVVDFISMSTADQSMIDSICDGMKASGDPEMLSTVACLQSMKNPVACMSISIAMNTTDYVSDKTAEGFNKALISLYPDPTGASQALINISQRGTEALTNSSAISECAYILKETNSARQTAYNTAINAINEYMANPTEAAYQKVIDTKNSYYTLASESIDAFKGMAEAQNDSGLGAFNKHDTSSFDTYANYLRSQTAGTYVDNYATSSP